MSKKVEEKKEKMARKMKHSCRECGSMEHMTEQHGGRAGRSKKGKESLNMPRGEKREGENKLEGKNEDNPA